jgi:phytol kinase
MTGRPSAVHSAVKELHVTQRDTVGLVLSYLYAFGLLFVVEAIGKRLKWPQYLTRKIVHIGAGMWIWGILALFDNRTYGLIPFATFIVLNFIFYRFQIFKAMDTRDSSPGTVYFAISITILFGLLWRTNGDIDRVVIAAAAVMAMTWGDGMASIVGQGYGKRFYDVFAHRRSWEGTAAMALSTFLVVGATLLFLPGSAWSAASVTILPAKAMLMALTAALVAAAAEGVSPAGTDNLTVPLLTGLVLFLFTL